MILTPDNNLPVSGPSLDNVASALIAYRTWVAQPAATADDLYAFITVPSADRTEFLASLTHAPVLTGSFIDNKYVAS